ncbi:class A sortase [Enterococcus faecalis]|uniref:class A sortase n=1 Tax=Enterococcus TaxID=1350 RepID=UPI001D16EBC5|nr:class A sortase [Enterococcus faecalis]
MTERMVAMKYVKNIAGKTLILLFFLIGLGLIFNKQIESFVVKNQSDIYSLKSANAAELQKNNQKSADFNFQTVNEMSPEAVLKAKLSNKKLPVIGGIAIPEVSLNLSIFKGISNEALLWGAGTMSENQKMGEGNYGLASHRAYEPGLLFSPLEKVELGDKVYLTDLVNIYEYTVNFKEKVAPTKTELLNVQPGKKLITLVTCGDMNATTRLVVQGTFVRSILVKKAPKSITDAFEIEQKTY